MSSKVRSIFNDKDVIDNLTDLHNKYVVVPADKASNNIVFVILKKNAFFITKLLLFQHFLSITKIVLYRIL